jgi:hypothetical protein
MTELESISAETGRNTGAEAADASINPSAAGGRSDFAHALKALDAPS